MVPAWMNPMQLINLIINIQPTVLCRCRCPQSIKKEMPNSHSIESDWRQEQCWGVTMSIATSGEWFVSILGHIPRICPRLFWEVRNAENKGNIQNHFMSIHTNTVGKKPFPKTIAHKRRGHSHRLRTIGHYPVESQVYLRELLPPLFCQSGAW